MEDPRCWDFRKFRDEVGEVRPECWALFEVEKRNLVMFEVRDLGDIALDRFEVLDLGGVGDVRDQIYLRC